MPLFLSYLHALPYRQLILDCSPFFRLCIPGFFFNLLLSSFASYQPSKWMKHIGQGQKVSRELTLNETQFLEAQNEAHLLTDIDQKRRQHLTLIIQMIGDL